MRPEITRAWALLIVPLLRDRWPTHPLLGRFSRVGATMDDFPTRLFMTRRAAREAAKASTGWPAKDLRPVRVTVRIAVR